MLKKYVVSIIWVIMIIILGIVIANVMLGVI